MRRNRGLEAHGIPGPIYGRSPAMAPLDDVQRAALKLADAIRAASGWPRRGETHYRPPTPAQLDAKARVDREFERLIERHLRALLRSAARKSLT